MRSQTWIHACLLAAFPVLPLARTDEPPPSGAIRISGTLTMTFAERHPIPVGDAEGHVLVLAQAKGMNRNTGPTDYMAGGEVASTEIADLTQGNGPHQG
jgi:hypothetical protein